MQAVKDKLQDMNAMRKAKAAAKEEEKAEKDLAKAKMEVAHEVRLAKEAEAAMGLHVARAGEKVEREVAKHAPKNPNAGGVVEYSTDKGALAFGNSCPIDGACEPPHSSGDLVMTRKKVNFAYITNDSARKATFKKRKKGLLKKMSELSTLCAIQTCAIIYSPYDPEPEVWPSPLGAQSVIARFKNMPEAEQSRKMMNQGSFLRQRITKFEEQVKKQKRENRKREMTQVMYKSLVGNQGLQNLGVVDLNDLGWLIEKTVDEIDERIKLLREQIMPPPQVVTAGTSSGHVNPTNKKNYGDSTKNIADMAMDVYAPNQLFMSMDPDVGFGLRNEDMTVSQNPQWLVELLRSNDQNMGGLGRNEDMLPFSYNSNNSSTLWSTFDHFP